MARLLVFLLVLCAQPVWAQQVLTATVRDATTQELLPFCSVGVKGTNHGTLTNEEGLFRLSVSSSDTLVISFIGYKTQLLPVTQTNAVVLLQPAGKSLPEVEVYHNPRALYVLLDRCRRILESQKPQTARVYFTLETQVQDQPVEALECYYNAQLTGAGIQSLSLKNGRVALAEHEQEYFVNLNTSKAFSYLSLTEHSTAMPLLPLQFGKQKMQKMFALQLTGISTENPEVQQITFQPKNQHGNCFSGELWINRQTAELLQVKLTAEQATQHPFLPLFPTDSVYQVSLDITQNFRGGQMELMQFNYQLKQQLNRTRNGAQTQKEKEFSSRGMVYAFDYGNPFLLPLFDYDATQTDYRKISFLPYNATFWEHNSQLALTESQKQKMRFFEREGLLLNFQNHTDSKQKPLFGHNYTFWSDTARISFKDLPAENLQQKTIRQNALPSDLYHLHVQLYLDAHGHNGATYFHTATVFDPFQTFYYLPQNPYTQVFLNIFFDLCETERRKLEATLQQKPLTLAQMQVLHRQAQENLRNLTRSYVQETEHGKNLRALKKWNARVLSELGIDNLKLLGPKYELAAPN